MTKEEAAEMCFKNVRAVTKWGEGNPIPPECERLMRMAKGRELSISEDWEQFKMLYYYMELPTGQAATDISRYCTIGDSVLIRDSEFTHLLNLARAIANIKKKV